MTPLSGDPLSGKEDTKKVSSHPTTSCGVQAPFSESYFLIRGEGTPKVWSPKFGEPEFYPKYYDRKLKFGTPPHEDFI